MQKLTLYSRDIKVLRRTIEIPSQQQTFNIPEGTQFRPVTVFGTCLIAGSDGSLIIPDLRGAANPETAKARVTYGRCKGQKWELSIFLRRHRHEVANLIAAAFLPGAPSEIGDFMASFSVSHISENVRDNGASNLLSALHPAALYYMQQESNHVILMPTKEAALKRVEKGLPGFCGSHFYFGSFLHGGDMAIAEKVKARQQELISTGDWKLDLK